MRSIHPTALVSPGAELGEGVSVGPYCVIGPDVRIGDGTRLLSHVVADGRTTIGPRCAVWPFASLGTRTQDRKYRGGICRAEIGAETQIRECVTVSAATAEDGVTRVGARCLLMASSHVAHDCRLGDGVILANCATLAGHVELEDQVVIGGLSGVHQFVRIGRMTIVGGCSKVTQDLPPYMMADGHPIRVHAVNRVGLERSGVGEAARRQLRAAHRLLYRQGLPVRRALERIEALPERTPEVEHLVRFVRASQRGIARS